MVLGALADLISLRCSADEKGRAVARQSSIHAVLSVRQMHAMTLKAYMHVLVNTLDVTSIWSYYQHVANALTIHRLATFTGGFRLAWPVLSVNHSASAVHCSGRQVLGEQPALDVVMQAPRQQSTVWYSCSRCRATAVTTSSTYLYAAQ